MPLVRRRDIGECLTLIDVPALVCVSIRAIPSNLISSVPVSTTIYNHSATSRQAPGTILLYSVSLSPGFDPIKHHALLESFHASQ